MISLQEALEQKRKDIEVIPKFKSQRAELLCELYSYYEKDYKIQAWKSYIQWLKANRMKHTIINLQEYKKVAYPKITVKSFCSFWVSHIPTNDLYYLISIARDYSNRGQSFNKWLFFALKAQDNSKT